MASVFTQIRNKEIPGHVLYVDSVVFAVLSIGPHASGHLLVIPIEEYEDLLQVPDDTYTHLMKVAQGFMRATKALYSPPRVALVAAGLEVEHTHLHVYSLFQNEALDHDAILQVTPAELLAEAERIRAYVQEYPVV